MPGFLGSLAIRTPWSFHCAAAEKNALCGVCGQARRAFSDQRPRLVRDLSCGDQRVDLAFSICRVWCRRCGGVKREGLQWLADHPLSTRRFAFYVGRRCRESPVKAIAEELHLD
jgi:transposase